ncbi:MAG TPA: YbhB/YbcL family Raf kinase inhibitor-like protein [Candidatus Saccharimonadales bacterium]|nr:YbhB/YbcL family Raf kinase inhibitor-like protein [Candidatus Saccharimonadales bacterium]
MQLTSSLFTNQSSIPADYTCKGRNISPSLHIEGVPAEAKSLALIMHDPDAPNGDFTHWVIWNIPPSETDIVEGAAPDTTTEGANDFGTAGYGGPCPPSGTHRYVFDLYALDAVVNLPRGSLRTQIEAAMAGHVIEQAQLVGLCSA